MNKEEIIQKLQSKVIRKRLLDTGITHLWIFGSFAHGKHTPDSDIDLVYDFDASYMKPTSRGVGGAYACLTEYLGRELDMVNKKYIHPSIEKNVLSSMIAIY